MAVFIGPKKYWKKSLKYMAGAQHNNVVCDFPAELNFLFPWSFLWATSRFHKLECYTALIFGTVQIDRGSSF